MEADSQVYYLSVSGLSVFCPVQQFMSCTRVSTYRTSYIFTARSLCMLWNSILKTKLAQMNAIILFFRLHDIFRNTSPTGNNDNLELACDGVILDMDYNPLE